MDKHECSPENASRMLAWIRDRGGIAVWRSINLSNPNGSWSSPVLTNGEPTSRPTWEAEGKPSRIITDANDVVVITRKEVKRFRVGLRGIGLVRKLTDASTRKLRAACKKAGEDSSYEFDYETQEAVITAPDTKVSLAEWKP
jgi:hypothetical protein